MGKGVGVRRSGESDVEVVRSAGDRGVEEWGKGCSSREE